MAPYWGGGGGEDEFGDPNFFLFYYERFMNSCTPGNMIFSVLVLCTQVNKMFVMLL